MNSQAFVSGSVVPLHGPMAPHERTRPPQRTESIAIVHDWCPDFRGGERVLAELCRLGCDVDVFTLFDFLSDSIKKEHFGDIRFQTSIADRWPAVRKYYRSLFFLCPFLIEQFDVTGHDMVLSSSAAFARGVITRPDQPHICYVHSPVRYAWDEQFSYLKQAALGFGPKGLLYRALLHRLRMWDARTAHGPDLLLANSHFVKARIKRVYGRSARVVSPPVPLDELTLETRKDDYYVTASFLAPYKRTDLVIEAFRSMPDRRLIVVGDGQQSKALRAMAGPNVQFTGYLPRADFVSVMARAKALLFAGCEDFGIALAEAQGCGTPVIAFARGGARDIVVPLGAKDPTGLLFERQTIESLRDAIDHFESNRTAISPYECRRNAERFSPAHFQQHMHAAIDGVTDAKRRQFGTA